jgi:hypothetical protein
MKIVRKPFDVVWLWLVVMLVPGCKILDNTSSPFVMPHPLPLVLTVTNAKENRQDVLQDWAWSLAPMDTQGIHIRVRQHPFVNDTGLSIPDTVVGRRDYDTIPADSFVIEFGNVCWKGANYSILIWCDANGNGQMDPPNTTTGSEDEWLEGDFSWEIVLFLDRRDTLQTVRFTWIPFGGMAKAVPAQYFTD